MDGSIERRTRVLIADDHAFSRRALRILLSTWPGMELVGEAQDGCEALELVEVLQPEVVLMDLQMPVCDGLEATRCIKHRWPQVRVIALTVHAGCQAAALAAGADQYLLKGCGLEELLSAIQRPGDSQRRPVVAPKALSGSALPGGVAGAATVP
ncbi:MAG: response regulator transcription factor [Anaerolineae bacterium]|nr:response regulator transcription factor [Anaerolineae bacterium]